MKKTLLVTALSLVTLFAGHPAVPAEKTSGVTPSDTPHRTDFTREEFGIGREHTANKSCNRKIDQLLDEIRVCVNTRPEAECTSLRKANNQQIGQLKYSRHCVR